MHMVLLSTYTLGLWSTHPLNHTRTRTLLATLLKSRSIAEVVGYLQSLLCLHTGAMQKLCRSYAEAMQKLCRSF